MGSVQPSRLVPPPLLSSKPAVNWNTYFDAVSQAFSLHLAAMQWPADQCPVLVEDFPRIREGQFDTSFDVILWTVHSSVMAPWDNRGERVPNGITNFGAVPNKQKTGYLEVTAGWKECLTSEFQIYAKSNARANYLATWFHEFWMLYTFSLKFFKGFGVDYARYVGREKDEKNQDFGEVLYLRRLRYETRLALVHSLDAKTIESASLSIGVTSTGEQSTYELSLQ
jgi:hypothetical protein